jgi:hypothetical protein
MSQAFRNKKLGFRGSKAAENRPRVAIEKYLTDGS